MEPMDQGNHIGTHKKNPSAFNLLNFSHHRHTQYTFHYLPFETVKSKFTDQREITIQYLDGCDEILDQYEISGYRSAGVQHLYHVARVLLNLGLINTQFSVKGCPKVITPSDYTQDSQLGLIWQMADQSRMEASGKAKRGS